MARPFNMMILRQYGLAQAVAASAFLGGLGSIMLASQQLDPPIVIQGVDAAVKARTDAITGYTATEHYAVYRGSDVTHPVAEMTVKANYNKDSGKSYTPISQSGSEIIRSTLLSSILDNEKRLSQPGNREGAWITSANYEMKMKSDGIQIVDGRNCLVLLLTPRRSSPFLFSGTLWVDAKDFSIVQLEGTASKSASILAGPAQVARQYADLNGLPMATHARAVSNSFLFGQVTVKIDYKDYQVELLSAK
jgi:hypothetical protein